MDLYQEQILNFLKSKRDIYQKTAQSPKMFIFLNWLWVFIIALSLMLSKMWWLSIVCIVLYLPVFIWLLNIKSLFKSILWGLAVSATSIALFLGIVYPIISYDSYMYIILIEAIISILNITIFEVKLHFNLKKNIYKELSIMKGTSKYPSLISAVITVLAICIMRRIIFYVPVGILYSTLLVCSVWFSSFVLMLAYMQFKILYFCHKYDFE